MYIPRFVSYLVYVSPAVMKEFTRIVEESGILQKSHRLWPHPDRMGGQELEIRIGSSRKRFKTCKIGSLVDVESSQDPEGLKTFYYLVQDIKCLVLALVQIHFTVKPI